MTAGKIQYSKISFILLGLICVGALFVRLDGLQWPKLHPDETVIGAWIENSGQSLYIQDRVYPNGFIALARPFVWINQAFIHVGRQYDYHRGVIDRIGRSRVDGIYLGRWLNALYGALLCIPVFLLVSRITRSTWAGLFSAGLLGFAQYSVEHSHYAETDIAALLTLAVALLLWVVFIDTGGGRWFAGAALVSGFAAGTKFTVIALAPIMLIEAVILIKRSGKVGNWQRALRLSCLGLLLFGVGFVLANPAVVLDFSWFWSGLAAEKRRVFAETALNLGPMNAQPSVKYLHHLWCLGMNARPLGYPWLLLLAAGLPCMVLGVARRYWTILFLFPSLFAFYWIFMAPWVRSQEFLVFLPSCAALAALPLTALWRARNTLCRFAVLAVAILAIAVNAGNGLRVAELFGWKDTRLLAREWLQIRLPLESKLAAESYAEAACAETWNLPVCIRKIEYAGVQEVIDQGGDYLLRASSIAGRGLHNPSSGNLYPEPARRLEHFLGNSELLCSWAPLPPQGLATFVSPTIELYGLKHIAPTASLQLELSQPLFIVNSDQNPAGRQTFFPTGHRLGCATGLLIDRLPQTIAVGGPDSLARPVYLVLNTAERPATVKILGFGLEKKVSLEPYDTAVVPLKRSKWQPFVKSFETITLETEPVKDVLYIPCYARLAYTAAEAARIFLDTAREDRLTKYFPEDLLEKELGPELKYIIATRLGMWSMADKNEKDAAALQAEIENCLRTETESIAINGCSGYYYDQFARGRLQKPYDFAFRPAPDENNLTARQDAAKVLDLQLPENGGGSEHVGRFEVAHEYTQTLALPVLLARGQYQFRGEIMLRSADAGKTSSVSLAVYPAQGSTAPVYQLKLKPGQWQNFDFAIQPGMEIQPCLEFRAPAASQIYLKNMEINWNLAEALESVKDDLAMAAIRHGIHKTDWNKVAGQLATLPVKIQKKNELEVRQMRFLCAGGLNDKNMLLQTARGLLDLAPEHYLCLSALAVEDANSGAAARQREMNLANPPVFGPWLALVGFSFNPATREARCIFEVLRNNTPRMAATFWLMRRGEWRHKQVQPLSAKPWLHKGERIIVVVRLNEAFGPEPDLKNLGLGIETDVLWHAGAISSLEGGHVIPAASLQTLSNYCPIVASLNNRCLSQISIEQFLSPHKSSESVNCSSNCPLPISRVGSHNCFSCPLLQRSLALISKGIPWWTIWQTSVLLLRSADLVRNLNL